MEGFYLDLYRILGEDRVLIDEPMKKHTTFRVGGPAAYYVLPQGEEELSEIIRLCRENNMPFYMIGNGSNLLVSDKGYDGVIISLEKSWGIFSAHESKVTAGAGAMLSRIAGFAGRESLTGLEFAAGIPGSLGGAIVMNAGAYGGEMSQVLSSVKVMDMEGAVKELFREELELGYRASSIIEKNYIVLEAVLELEHGNIDLIENRMAELSRLRRSKQPLEYPSAGSTFKRPKGYFAGKLIQDAGLRGFRLGGAMVSDKHCGFVINVDHATASEIMELCHVIRKRVLETSGVELELEVRTLGEF